jgi:hypothetical protein
MIMAWSWREGSLGGTEGEREREEKGRELKEEA